LKLVSKVLTDYLLANVVFTEVFGQTFNVFFSAKISVSSIKFSSLISSYFYLTFFFTVGL